MLIMVDLSWEHIRVWIIHNHASFEWEVCFSCILVFDLVVLMMEDGT